MNQAFIASAIGRIRSARYAKAPGFRDEVEAALKEALSQPFGEPLAVARIHSNTAVPGRRAVWSAVARRLECEPELLADWSRRPRAPAPSRRAPEITSAFQYEVGLLTDVGPGSAGDMLNGLAKQGLAGVKLVWEKPGSPALLYSVPEEHVLPTLEPLRLRAPAPVAAE